MDIGKARELLQSLEREPICASEVGTDELRLMLINRVKRDIEAQGTPS